MKALLLLALGATVAGAQTNSHVVAAAGQAYAARAAVGQAAGLDFTGIFSNACRQVLDTVAGNPRRRVDDEARAMLGGLWQWARRGGRPLLQGQADKALHFLGGGAFQAYWDAGHAAAVIKEEIDRGDPGNRFDLDDLAATMLGARWADLATTSDAAANQRWLARWASGECSLAKTLPALKFGRLSAGATATPEELKAIQEAVTAALPAP